MERPTVDTSLPDLANYGSAIMTVGSRSCLICSSCSAVMQSVLYVFPCGPSFLSQPNNRAALAR
jgi:hypothetical protein